MAEQKESSVLFSLKELMNLEEDRIKQEEAEKRRTEEAAIQARLDAERRAREEEEARIRAADEERRRSEERSREEQARLDAIRQAEVEKARLEAENAARIEQLRHQQEHEHRIAALHQDQGKKKLLWIAIGAGALLMVALIGGGVAIKNANERQAQLEAKLTEIMNANSDLTKKMTEAKSPEEVAALKQQLEENQKTMDDLKKGQASAEKVTVKKVGGGGPRPQTGSGGGNTPKPACTCQAGDPLCSCL